MCCSVAVRLVRRHAICRGLGHPIVGVARLAVLGVALGERVLAAIDVRFLGLVALANLVGRGVRGQHVGVAAVGIVPVAAEESAEAAAAVARGVVVGGRRAEALFFLAVPAETKFGQGRNDKEDT